MLEYKNKTKTKKVEPKINEKDNELVSFEDIRKNKVECINDQITESRMRASEKQKEVDISSAKYSLFEYLGKDNVEELCKK